MHRNPWWLTPDGPTLDSGAYVAGLEFAAETRATVIGKPSSTFFSMAVADLRRDGRARPAPRPRSRWSATTSGPTSGRPSGPGCAASSSESGKHGLADVEAAAVERGGRRPDAIAADLASVVAALVAALD